MTSYNLPDGLHGDTFNPVEFELLRSDDTPVDLSNARIDLWIRRGSEKGDVVKKLVSGDNNGISLINAAEGKFRIDGFVVDMQPGNYVYDIQFYDRVSGLIKTYIRGTWKVLPDITSPDLSNG